MDVKVYGGFIYNDFFVFFGYIGFFVFVVIFDFKIIKKIILKIFFVFLFMDIVIEYEMVIYMVFQGGFGVIYYNCFFQVQVDFVCKVKCYENGFIFDFVVISCEIIVGEVKVFKEKWGFGGFFVIGQFFCFF